MTNHLDLIVKKWPFIEYYFNFVPLPYDLEKFLTWPAATGTHHAYPTGLIEHTYEVMELVSGFHNIKNLQAVLTAAYFHDIGKTLEYNSKGEKILPANSHVQISADIYKQVCDKLKIECDLSIYKMILAHHGRLEWGSVKKAVTQQEHILHACDYGSCKLNVKPTFDGIEECYTISMIGE